jgi:hypothetical protein
MRRLLRWLRGARFEPASRSLSLQRILLDAPLRAERVIPSRAALPLAAQRDFRGWIVIAILVMIAIGVVEVSLLITHVARRTAYVAPSAQRIGSATARREATDFEASSLAMMAVTRLESYTPATAAEAWSVVLPFLHPALHQSLKAQYEAIAIKARTLWQHRVAMCLGVAMGGRKAGIIMLAVFYDSAELTGKTEAVRTLSKIVPKAAYVEFAMDVPDAEDPTGLKITAYQTYERSDWLARGFPDLWEHYRALPAAAGK